MNILIAAAGTGGHINPAIAIANIIVKKYKEANILFVGTKSGLENKLVENAGYKIVHIRTGKIIREFTLENINQMYNAYRGISDATKLIKEFKPDLVIGTGGYICVPVMLAAKREKVPYVLHESNAYPGVSVKLLSKSAQSVMISFKEAKDRLKYKKNVVYTGTPTKFLAEDIDNLDVNECRKKIGLDKIDKKIILVTCGSQGAKKVNETIIDMIKNMPSDKYYIYLVTGDRSYDEIKNSLNEMKKEKNIDIDKYIKLEKFVFDMAAAYKACDFAITRGGAMTITELSVAGKPAIIIPLPTAAENHQYYNAKVLEDAGAALILEQKNLNINSLNDSINKLIDDDILLDMSKKSREKNSKDTKKRIEKVLDTVLNNK